MNKYIAPSGSPIKTKDLAYWILCSVGMLDKRPAITDTLNKRCNTKYCYLFSTGRGAMTLLLKSLKRLANKTNKNEVIIPAYTCYSVASSVINSGLKIRLCDIDPETLSFDCEQLDKIPCDKVLCIITANLYGLPNQLDKIDKYAKKNNIYLIDDAAQSYGAVSNGKKVGTYGIAGLYSFDKGKNITSIEGGVILTNSSALSEIINKQYKSLESLSVKHNLQTIVKIIIYYLFLNPMLYWIPASIPFLNLGKTRYEHKISIKKYSRLVAPLALRQIERSEAITQIRVRNGLWYRNNIEADAVISTFRECNGAQSVYLRFPIKINDRLIRSTVLSEGQQYGISISYPKSLNNVDEIMDFIVNNGKFRGAEQVSERLVTLPTHAYVTQQDRQNIVARLKRS